MFQCARHDPRVVIDRQDAIVGDVEQAVCTFCHLTAGGTDQFQLAKLLRLGRITSDGHKGNRAIRSDIDALGRRQGYRTTFAQNRESVPGKHGAGRTNLQVAAPGVGFLAISRLHRQHYVAFKSDVERAIGLCDRSPVHVRLHIPLDRHRPAVVSGTVQILGLCRDHVGLEADGLGIGHIVGNGGLPVHQRFHRVDGGICELVHGLFLQMIRD